MTGDGKEQSRTHSTADHADANQTHESTFESIQIAVVFARYCRHSSTVGDLGVPIDAALALPNPTDKRAMNPRSLTRRKKRNRSEVNLGREIGPANEQGVLVDEGVGAFIQN